jgi:hypothetical protein
VERSVSIPIPVGGQWEVGWRDSLEVQIDHSSEELLASGIERFVGRSWGRPVGGPPGEEADERETVAGGTVMQSTAPHLSGDNEWL